MEKLLVDDCFIEIRNGANIKQGIIDGGYPITRIETLSNGCFNRDRMGYAGITDIEKYSDYVLEDEDLLMSHINSVQYLARTVLYKKKDDEIIIHGMNLLRLKARKDIVYPAYIKYYFSGRKFRDNIYKITKKSVNQASFTVADLKRIILQLPEIKEQTFITERLAKIEKIIELRNSQLKALDELIKSRFVEMFGEPITNSKSLPVISLGKACNMKAGKSIKAVDIKDKFEEKLYPCYGGNGLRGYVKSYTHEGAIPLIGRQGALCGNVQYAEGKFYATEHAVVTQPIINWNTCWLFIMLREMNLNRLASGAAQPGLNVSTLVPLEVINPPLDLQNQFAAFVKQVDKLKFHVIKSLDETQLLFDSLMQKYFG